MWCRRKQPEQARIQLHMGEHTAIEVYSCTRIPGCMERCSEGKI